MEHIEKDDALIAHSCLLSVQTSLKEVSSKRLSMTAVKTPVSASEDGVGPLNVFKSLQVFKSSSFFERSVVLLQTCLSPEAARVAAAALKRPSFSTALLPAPSACDALLQLVLRQVAVIRADGPSAGANGFFFIYSS